MIAPPASCEDELCMRCSRKLGSAKLASLKMYLCEKRALEFWQYEALGDGVAGDSESKGAYRKLKSGVLPQLVQL
jgi:hypothetical protein